MGRAFLLCPAKLDLNLLCYRKSIIDIDAEVPDSALYLGVTEQELNRSQIAGTATDQGCLRSPQ